MKWSLVGKRNAISFVLALLLIGIDSIISYHNAIKLIQNANKVKHTHEVIKTLTEIHATLTDSESNLLAYILFKDESELKRYNLAVQSIPQKIETLSRLNSANRTQQQRLVALESLISERQALFKQSMGLYQSGKLPSDQALLLNRSKRSRDEIKAVIAQMQTEEEELLALWIRTSEYNIRYRMLIEFLSIFLSCTILFGVYALLYRQMAKRQKAEKIQFRLSKEKELSDLKLRLFSMVSHEFRTPLSVILGSSQLLAENSEKWTESKRRKNIQRIQSSAKLMTKLLSDILTIERAEAGKLECNRELVDLEAFCLNLVEDIHVGGDNRHEIEFVSRGGCTRAELDEKLLYSILSNLLSNAIKYSPNGGKIYFTLSCEAEVVSFQIKDEGIGIPEEFQQQLYEPFHRSYNVRDIVGVGLGLAVVKKCLDIHQGEISLESQEGMGTTFTVTIPLSSK